MVKDYYLSIIVMLMLFEIVVGVLQILFEGEIIAKIIHPKIYEHFIPHVSIFTGKTLTELGPE
jgi:hypothetical protein